ncbi:matrix metalloproteinase-28 isoform X2 [Cebus imitator]|uniref:matrix metalloproteinase-28 isoform X2 n=1 Tax=Cebus imitator TaxID=2715852 RepID=UPI001899161A|nr:matrix metalloproteinase-28 isoform X2 [Cebus imitator]
MLQMRRQNSLDLGRTACKRSRRNLKPGNATPLHAFLEKYGYFNEQVPKAPTSTRFSNAVRAFQWVSQLPVSGVLDRTTLRQMTRPRCGVADTDSYEAWTERISDLFAGHQSQMRRKKRFAKQGNKWYKQHLSYRLVNWPERLPEPAVRGAVRAAFQLWSNVSALEFWEAPATGPADIRLTFFQGDHNDGLGNAFDGPGGALAHAFLPRRGEAHFDQDERWSLSRRRGRNLFVVLAHEIGHTLGLTHSPAPRALMAPYYKRLGRDALLSWDDVLAVQSLYGKPLGGSVAVQLPGKLFTDFEAWDPHSPQGRQPETQGPQYCHSSFDAITVGNNKCTFLKGATSGKWQLMATSQSPVHYRKGGLGCPPTLRLLQCHWRMEIFTSSKGVNAGGSGAPSQCGVSHSCAGQGACPAIQMPPSSSLLCAASSSSRAPATTCWPEGVCKWNPTTPEVCRTGAASLRRSAALCRGPTAPSSSSEMTNTGASTRPNCGRPPRAAGPLSCPGWAAGMLTQEARSSEVTSSPQKLVVLSGRNRVPHPSGRTRLSESLCRRPDSKASIWKFACLCSLKNAALSLSVPTRWRWGVGSILGKTKKGPRSLGPFLQGPLSFPGLEDLFLLLKVQFHSRGDGPRIQAGGYETQQGD